MQQTRARQARRILAHRGLWKAAHEQNTPKAIQRAINAGYGVELDIRDRHGDLVVSHDPACNEAPQWEDLDTILATCMSHVALNIKSDGLAPMLKGISAMYPGTFAFDMSWPQTLDYIDQGISVALRASEYESAPPSLFRRLGIPCRIWLDSFHEDWWLENLDLREWPPPLSVFVVSPEIHGRDPSAAWKWVHSSIQKGIDVFLCTDYCADALEAIS